MRVRRSLSAVSKPNFARKYALESSRRDLQGLHAFAPFWNRSDLNISENFRQTFSHFSAKFCKFLILNLRFFENVSLNFAQSLMKFCRNFANIFEHVEKF